jgi:lipoate-protein ligase A
MKDKEKVGQASSLSPGTDRLEACPTLGNTSGAVQAAATQHQGMNSWWLINSGRQPAAHNMAVDEALLLSMPRWQQPVLRFYGWTEPAATFGYFQKYAEVAQRTPLRPLVRRPTGGGIVPHEADWTYCLSFPAGHFWHELAAVESYQRVHEWIQSAFARLQVATELAPGSRHTAPGACFEGYEKSDVLWHGRKIAGAAQRRNKLGLLIQGSVQPPPVSLARADWEWAMREAAGESWRVDWQEFPGEALLEEQVEALMRGKYSQGEYNQKR